MVCRCASKAKELGYPFFGIQFYRECWAGKRFAIHGKKRKSCVDAVHKSCAETGSERVCSGPKWTNFVYFEKEVCVHNLSKTFHTLSDVEKFVGVIVNLCLGNLSTEYRLVV